MDRNVNDAGARRADAAIAAVLGAAIGDAMGHPTEFLSLAEIHEAYGPGGVRGFELYWERDGKRFAPYTDDTQMAEIVLHTLIEARSGGWDLDTTMRRMASGFVDWDTAPQGGHRAPGNACRSGARALAAGVPWAQAGGEKAGGCGSVMRAYPFGLVYWDDEEKAELWAVEHSKLTHRDPIALAACAAMAVGMAQVLRQRPVDRVVKAMIDAARRYSEPTARMMEEAAGEAHGGVGPEITLERLQAWAAHEAIAAAVYLLIRHPDDPAAAILEGANTPGDSDSIATLGGALVAARTGLASLPMAWVRDLERSEELRALAQGLQQHLASADVAVGALEERFAEVFANWAIRLPRETIAQRHRGQLCKAGWSIWYLFGRDERGEYLDYYASHRMTSDEHVRIRADGETERLPSLLPVRWTSKDPIEDKKLEDEFFSENRRIGQLLEEKGFGLSGDEPLSVQMGRVLLEGKSK